MLGLPLFTEPAGNDDNFYAVLFDYDFNIIDDFSTGDTSFGTVTWDISTLSISDPLDIEETFLGIEFQLNSNIGDSVYSSVQQTVTEDLSCVDVFPCSKNWTKGSSQRAYTRAAVALL